MRKPGNGKIVKINGFGQAKTEDLNRYEEETGYISAISMALVIELVKEDAGKRPCRQPGHAVYKERTFRLCVYGKL
ncbi:MAG: hypothetical protein K2K90_09950 [Lachnospiraceae bacterium]|nr:hypothetical protein [Lachnospiraceae bacterium]